MLMMPPALATKSGAHRIARSASSAATESAASWLLAERARRDHVDRRDQPAVGIGPARAQLRGERALALVDVGHRQVRAGLREQPRQAAADAAEADHGHRPAV